MAPTTRSQSRREAASLVKILNANRIHNEFLYKEGLNVCPQPWNNFECSDGGLYACPLRNLFNWLPFFRNAGSVAWVDVPEEAKRITYPTKIKADRLVLKEEMSLYDAVTLALPLVDPQNLETHSVFAWAAICGHADIVRLLVDAGWDIHYANDSALTWVEQSGSAEAVRILLDAGGVFSQVSINWVFRNAVISWHYDCIRLLLSKGADVNYDNGFPLCAAAAAGNAECVQLFLDAGATSYDLALEKVTLSKQPSARCARMLIKAGARQY